MAISADIKSTPVHVGDLVRVHLKVLEQEKVRVQIFEGLIIGIRGRQENRSFTVRKIASGGIGVERIFPLNSPCITKVDIKKKGTIRRAKLNYIRRQSTRRVAQITQSSS